MANYSVGLNPYTGLAESIVTSNVFNVMDAFDWSYSWTTTGGGAATSAVTLQLSIDPTRNAPSIAEASWSAWTVFGSTAPVPLSGSTIKFPPLGVRWVRFLRKVASAASVSINVNKQVR